MNPEFRSRCWLLKNGVPFTIAFGVTDMASHERHAMAIVFSELEGATFNWQTWAWEKQD